MAGKPLAKKTLAELSRRGGAEYVREWLLEGKSLRDLAADLDVSRGYFNNLLLKNEDYEVPVVQMMGHTVLNHPREATTRTFKAIVS